MSKHCQLAVEGKGEERWEQGLEKRLLECESSVSRGMEYAGARSL